MEPSILEAVGERVLLADGAVGTELQRAGLEPGGCCELWNVEQPEKVMAVHRAYVEAGAQLITTNSFRGHRIALYHYGFGSRVEEFNHAAARLAREAAGESAWVMGSIGPSGGLLEPAGEISIADAFNAFAEQAQALLEGGVDAIIIETMTATDELDLAVRAAREAGASVIIASMAFDKVKGGYKTMAGVALERAVEAMMKAGADVIGCNCGASMTMSDYARVVEIIRSRSSKPIIAQPNAGQPELIEGRIVYKRTPEVMAATVESLARAGANIIGGCCGTTPEHIRLFGEKMRLYV